MAALINPISMIDAGLFHVSSIRFSWIELHLHQSYGAPMLKYMLKSSSRGSIQSLQKLKQANKEGREQNNFHSQPLHMATNVVKYNNFHLQK